MESGREGKGVWIGLEEGDLRGKGTYAEPAGAKLGEDDPAHGGRQDEDHDGDGDATSRGHHLRK